MLSVAIGLGFDGAGAVREITRGFLVFCLFFGQEAGEGYDVRVDLL